jgi:hypothetical protein
MIQRKKETNYDTIKYIIEQQIALNGGLKEDFIKIK